MFGCSPSPVCEGISLLITTCMFRWTAALKNIWTPTFKKRKSSTCQMAPTRLLGKFVRWLNCMRWLTLLQRNEQTMLEFVAWKPCLLHIYIKVFSAYYLFKYMCLSAAVLQAAGMGESAERRYWTTKKTTGEAKTSYYQQRSDPVRHLWTKAEEK